MYKIGILNYKLKRIRFVLRKPDWIQGRISDPDRIVYVGCLLWKFRIVCANASRSFAKYVPTNCIFHVGNYAEKRILIASGFRFNRSGSWILVVRTYIRNIRECETGAVTLKTLVFWQSTRRCPNIVLTAIFQQWREDTNWLLRSEIIRCHSVQVGYLEGDIRRLSPPLAILLCPHRLDSYSLSIVT